MASIFKVEITLGNDAMQTPAHVATALREIAAAVDETGVRGGLVVDENGNDVGRFRLAGMWPE